MGYSDTHSDIDARKSLSINRSVLPRPLLPIGYYFSKKFKEFFCDRITFKIGKCAVTAGQVVARATPEFASVH